MPFYRDYRDQFLSAVGASIEGTTCPWRFMFSHNFSLSRTLFLAVGQFNEDFGENWGLEDIELGFRLHQAGARFYLDEEHHAYHQPHLEQSRQDQPLAMKNALLFSRLFPFLEIELICLFGTDLGAFYQEARRLLDEPGFSQQAFDISDPSKEIALAYLHSADLKVPGPAHHYWGMYIQNVATDSVQTVHILPAFHQFGELVQAGILAEAFRVGRWVRFADCTAVQETTIRNRSRLLGWSVSYERQGPRLTLSKKTKIPSRIFVLVLPSVFEPRRRSGYLAMALRLETEGCRVMLQDPKGTVTVAGEDFGWATEADGLDAIFGSQFAYLANRHIISSELVLSGLFTTLRPGSLVVDDLGYPGLDGYPAVPQIPGTLPVSGDFLDRLGLVHWLESGSATAPSAALHAEVALLAVMASGFDEDGIADLIAGFEALHEDFPGVRLTIKTLDDAPLAGHCFAEHNETSRRFKLQGALRKNERDRLKLAASVTASPARDAIRVIRDNWTMDDYGRFIASADAVVCATRGTGVPLEVSMALVQGVPVLAPGHLDSAWAEGQTLFPIETRQVSFAEAFEIPETSATIKLLAQVSDLDSLKLQMRNLHSFAVAARASGQRHPLGDQALNRLKTQLDRQWEQLF